MEVLNECEDNNDEDNARIMIRTTIFVFQELGVQ